MSLSLNLATCHACPWRQSVCAGSCRCRDGRDILAHAADGTTCPRHLHHKPSLSAGEVVHGAIGIAKALTGTGGAGDELVERRTAICRGCEHVKLAAGLLDHCDLCGCATWAKVRNASESCPIGKW